MFGVEGCERGSTQQPLSYNHGPNSRAMHRTGQRSYLLCHWLPSGPCRIWLSFQAPLPSPSPGLGSTDSAPASCYFLESPLPPSCITSRDSNSLLSSIQSPYGTSVISTFSLAAHSRCRHYLSSESVMGCAHFKAHTILMPA